MRLPLTMSTIKPRIIVRAKMPTNPAEPIKLINATKPGSITQTMKKRMMSTTTLTPLITNQQLPTKLSFFSTLSPMITLPTREPKSTTKATTKPETITTATKRTAKSFTPNINSIKFILILFFLQISNTTPLRTMIIQLFLPHFHSNL